MRNGGRLGQRLAHQQPARARLDRHINLPTRKAAHPAPHGLRCRSDAATVHLARLAVKRVESDLSSVDAEPGYDRHWRLLRSSDSCQLRASLSRRTGEAPVHAIYARISAVRIKVSVAR
jgi:hypothetical protein